MLFVFLMTNDERQLKHFLDFDSKVRYLRIVTANSKFEDVGIVEDRVPVYNQES